MVKCGFLMGFSTLGRLRCLLLYDYGIIAVNGLYIIGIYPFIQYSTLQPGSCFNQTIISLH